MKTLFKFLGKVTLSVLAIFETKQISTTLCPGNWWNYTPTERY